MAVEVKRKEYTANGKWRASCLKKAWIAQAASYFCFANIVYLGVNMNWEMVIARPIALRYLLKEGVGLLLLKDLNDVESWYEAIPPRYRNIRQTNATAFLAHYFPDFNSTPEPGHTATPTAPVTPARSPRSAAAN